MDIAEYHVDFLEQVQARASSESNFTHAEFVDYCADLLADADEVADFENGYFRGTGSKNRSLGVDGFALDETDGSMRLVIADYEGTGDARTLTQTQAKTVFSRLQAFCEDALSGRLHPQLEDSSAGFSTALTLFQQRHSITRLRFYLISDAVLSTRVRDWPEEIVGGIPAEFHIWDISRFYQVHQSKSGRDELEVDFTSLVAGGLPILPASVESEDYRAYLCVIPGKVLAGMYDRFGSRLLEGNVRSYLGTRGRINKSIRKTVTQEPKMFFAYNNGIACTASAAEVTNTPGGLRLTRVTDLQIVNGGQTTATLANALTGDSPNLDHTFVQMKLSVVSAENSGKFIPLIARYANSQNRVSDADFFSNHEFHRRVDQLSRSLRAPAVGGAQYGTHWIYERARGQYLNESARLTPAQKNLFALQNPRQQVITKTDLAKYENAWRFLPHTVSYGAQKNFLAFSTFVTAEWDKNPDQFNEEYYKRVVVKAIVFRRAEELVSKQPWYEGGYRAQIVAYAVAKFANLIQFDGIGKLFDFRSVWTRQALTPAAERQLVAVAERVLHVIVHPDGGLQNITEWCKKELCWTRVRDLHIPLTTELAGELVEREEEQEAKQKAQVTQKIMSGIEMQTKVVELGSAYWGRLRDWARKHGLLSPDEDSIVGVAANMPRRLPTERQCARILEIQAKVEEEGFMNETGTAAQ